MGLEIGSYMLTSKIGEGGMGEVWIGEHKLLKRKAAVKLLLKELAEDQNIVARFINEAKATSQIVHPGIVKIYDFGQTPDGHTYMIMELLEGETLHARARKRGYFPIGEALCIVRQMAEALGAAHSLHVVHRDLKPENVFLVPDESAFGGERVKILDFGIAKMLDGGIGAPHTRTGSILGTPVYMSPEQCSALPNIDHRADIYALGCVLFQLLCGRPPFDFATIGELLGAHVYTPAPVPSSIRTGLSPALDAVVLRMLAKQPQDRFGSMAEVVSALDGGGLDRAEAALGGRELTPPAGVPMARADAQAATIVDRPQPQTPSRPQAAPAVPSGATLVLPEPPDTKTVVMPEPPQARETTTLGGATGEKAAPPLPQPERRRASSVMVMGIAFAATTVLALGAFFVVGRGPTAGAPAPALVTLTIESEPSGAEVWRDGILLGSTPYVLTQAPSAASATFVLKRAGFTDGTLALPGDRDGKLRLNLTPAK